MQDVGRIEAKRNPPHVIGRHTHPSEYAFGYSGLFEPRSLGTRTMGDIQMSWGDLVATFADGDVLYGLDEGRAAAKDAILNKQPKTKIRVQFMCCFFRTKQVDRIVIQNVITDSVFDVGDAVPKLETGGKLYGTDKQIRSNKAVASDPERAIGFRDYLESHPKWNLQEGVSNDAVKGRGWQNNKGSGASVTELDRMRKALQRTSKAGLEYQLKQRRRKVHFILDGIDCERVVKKRVGDITSAELRWLYRHRSDANVMKNIKFWHEGKDCGPPWLWPKNVKAFAEYKPKHEQEIMSDDSEARDLQHTLQQTKVFRSSAD